LARSPIGVNYADEVSQMNSRVVFIFVFALCTGAGWAKDERSIIELQKALVALGPAVDPNEAQELSLTVHTMSRDLARQYRVVLNPNFQNFLINIGARQRGYCAHYVRDIGTRLREFKFKTLVLHWGAYDAKGPDESNCLVITARHQRFQDGIVLDAWRWGGRLFWSLVKKDHEYEYTDSIALNQFSEQRHTGITKWKEDMQESAWLQNSGPGNPEAKQD
jgi:hypothetical protein